MHSRIGIKNPRRYLNVITSVNKKWVRDSIDIDPLSIVQQLKTTNPILCEESQ